MRHVPIQCYRGDDLNPLDPQLCYVRVYRGYGLSAGWKQCQNKATLTRQFSTGQEHPCCTMHARAIEKQRAAVQTAATRQTAEEALEARCETLRAQGVECDPIYRDPKLVSIDINILEQLVQKGTK